MKLLKTSAAIVVLALMTGCASVNMAPQQESSQAKQFEAPEEGMAGVYVFRKESPFGAALKKDIWINDECIGESARGVFFYHQVEGDQEHEVATESEFSPNTLSLFAESGNNYFVEQYIKMGAFVGGANLRLVDEEKGMEEVSKLEMARSGTCSQ
ncbi:DUF2846 domain-containing protein [Billgrantia sp. LNSP4103-1]|uniref:DUF2846 domain-containing protein n=1 Tax=Billgrantia sp. LNSP4103-1 TaxID=3410266 RepID=UPI00403F74C7